MEERRNLPEQNRQHIEGGTPSQNDTNRAPAHNTGAENSETHKEVKKRRKISWAAINAIISSPVDRIRSQKVHDSLANTGTNVSYEGPTSTSACGTGYNSGQAATGATITSDDGYEVTGLGNHHHQQEEEKDNEKDII